MRPRSSRPSPSRRSLTAERHPQADKLQVLTVDAGTGEAIQVVCGAPNARAGMLGVFGAPGAYVPGSDLTLKVAAIRGVESRGMMCSVRELELGDAHDGIIELPADAPVGASYAAMGRARRSGDRRRGHPQSAGLHGRPRNRPRPRRRRARDLEAGRGRGRSPAPSPVRSRSAPTIRTAAPLSTAGSFAGSATGRRRTGFSRG